MDSFLPVLELDQIRIVLAITMLGIATVSDIRKRQVNNLVWFVFGIISIILIPFGADMNKELVNIGISLVVAPVALVLWRFGVFGGADAFAVITLALLTPSLTVTGGAITPFTILINAMFLSAVLFFANGIRNMILARKADIFEGFDETRPRKILAMFIGHKTANPRFGFSMECVEGNSKKLNLKLQHAERVAFCEKKDAWVTLGTPYMTFILAGFVIQLLYGDLFFSLLNSLS